MQILEVHTVNGADIFLAYFEEVKDKKQYYASYTYAGNGPEIRIDKQYLERVENPVGDFLKPYLNLLESEHAARVRMAKMVAAAPFVTFKHSNV